MLEVDVDSLLDVEVAADKFLLEVEVDADTKSSLSLDCVLSICDECDKLLEIWPSPWV